MSLTGQPVPLWVLWEQLQTACGVLIRKYPWGPRRRREGEDGLSATNLASPMGRCEARLAPGSDLVTLIRQLLDVEHSWGREDVEWGALQLRQSLSG